MQRQRRERRPERPPGRTGSAAANLVAWPEGLIDRALRMGEASKFKEYEKRVEAINRIEPEMELLEDAELRAEADELRERARDGESLDDLLPEAFALTREAARRTLGQRHFDVQLIGGMVLHDGAIAEMKTGEGKTLTATLPVFLNTLAGDSRPPRHRQRLPRPPRRRVDGADLRRARRQRRRDPGGRRPRRRRREKYACDVTYGTNSEFGFDYLRDNMAGSLEDCVQRGHHFAIVDEVDNILIDEARTPLIISGAPRAGRRPLLHLRPPRQADEGRARQGEAEVAGRVEGHLARPSTTTSTTRSTRPSRRPSAGSPRPRSSSASTTSTSASTAPSSTT